MESGEGCAGPLVVARATASSDVGAMGALDSRTKVAEEEREGGREGGSVAVEGVEGGMGVEKVEGLGTLASGGEATASTGGSGKTSGEALAGCLSCVG